MAWELKWIIRDNVDNLWPFKVTDADDQPYDFSAGDTFRMDLKASADDASATASLTTANGGIVSIDLANGKLGAYIGTFDVAAGTYLFDLVRITGETRDLLAYGTVEIVKGITGE